MFSSGPIKSKTKQKPFKALSDDWQLPHESSGSVWAYSSEVEGGLVCVCVCGVSHLSLGGIFIACVCALPVRVHLLRSSRKHDTAIRFLH